MAASHILSAVEPTVGGGGTRGGREREVNVALDDRELWVRFQTLTNEMIVTKNGRLVAQTLRDAFETRTTFPRRICDLGISSAFLNLQ